jgi:glycosyltransferase involved in cell wall biosynthesis
MADPAGSPEPIVSCIMPTANRAEFVPGAIACFLAQDFESRELVVIDNGTEPIENLLPADGRIRYQRVAPALKLGELRNRACEMARGEIIVHWDDDDWYPPDRISRQVERLGEGGAELCATSRIYFLEGGGARAWEYCSGGARPWLAGSSFAYRRTLWQRQKFQAIRVGEDACFSSKVPPGKVADLADPSLVIATMHSRNTSPKRPNGAAWKRTDARLVLALKSLSGAGGGGTKAAPAALPAPPGARVIPDSRRVCVGVYVRGDAARLAGTLKSLHEGTDMPIEVVVLADGVDAGTRWFLEDSAGLAVSSSVEAIGAAASFNRLLRERAADVYVFLESGSLVGPHWLSRLCAALDAHPTHGLAGPTTNMAWSVQGEFRNRAATERNVAMLAREAIARFGDSWRSLAPLYCLADFCFAARRSVVDAIGGADEGYGLGPCWEMDYALRAARAGFGIVWAQSAYVFRHPFTPQRSLDEKAWLEPSKSRYQRKFCGQLLGGAREEIADHCRGERCPHFAPSDAIALRLPLDAARAAIVPIPLVPSRAAEPLVSCIMPTRGRPEWVQQSIRYFQRQTYPARELIIVDDSRVSSEKDLPCDPRIRYVHREQRMTIGAMRNLACDMARGEFIAHWDDDDWYGPARLAAQVAPIAAGAADITAFAATPFFDVARGQMWSCSPELFARMFVHAVHGGTLVYARRLFDAAHRFPHVSIAEDAAFLRAAVMGGARLMRIDAGEHFVYMRHGENAWRFACGQAVDASGWIRQGEYAWLREDMPFYLARGQSLRRTA